MHILVVHVYYDSLEKTMPTPLSQNPRSGIKSSNWATYQMWHVGVIQATSPTAGGISEGLHASDVAYAHLANDVGNRHGESAKACTHKPWRVCIDWASTVMACTNRPTTGDIGQGLHEKRWCVSIWQTTSSNGTQHQPRPTCISRGLRASVGRHHPWPARLGQ